MESWHFERMFISHYVSCVTFHMPPVTCHIFVLFCFFDIFFTKKIKIKYGIFHKKNGQSGGDSWWRVCYQRGLPRLVSFCNKNKNFWFAFAVRSEKDEAEVDISGLRFSREPIEQSQDSIKAFVIQRTNKRSGSQICEIFGNTGKDSSTPTLQGKPLDNILV